MAKIEPIVGCSMDEIKAKLARGEDKTDYDRADSAEEIARQMAADPDLSIPDDWEASIVEGVPDIAKNRKQLVSVRYSPRVIAYFKSTGRGWQTRMDAVLTAFVDKQERERRR